ncbi:radical SAM protein [Lentzea sp. NPDC004789]
MNGIVLTGKRVNTGARSAVIDDPVTTEINVNWFGGEPLLAREQVFSIARTLRARAAARGVEYRSQLTTNGPLFTRQLIEDLVCEAGVTRIDVTVDGPRRVHDASRRMKNGTSTYYRILDSVGWALDQDWARRCTFILRTNITASSMPQRL